LGVDDTPACWSVNEAKRSVLEANRSIFLVVHHLASSLLRSGGLVDFCAITSVTRGGNGGDPRGENSGGMTMLHLSEGTHYDSYAAIRCAG
jgi:hypothetical protein